jgi:hypothetical protein
MKIGDVLKKAAAVIFPADSATRPASRDARREAITAYADWHREWAERQRTYRATHAPGVRVPGPRQLGMSWPPPPNPTGIPLTSHTEQDL